MLESVPVHCNVLCATREAALDAPRGRIELGFCENCGLIYNRAFEPERLEYTLGYENSLHFSPQFQNYVTALAERLITSHDLVGKDIIEIGCGSGEFLAELCRDGRNRGVGFDPSYDESLDETARSTVRIMRDEYSEKYTNRRADLICCRHVLEHVARPDAFLRSVRRAAFAAGDPLVYFEVPDGLWTLRDLGIWDIIYEHCSYFTRPALINLFKRTGFRPSDCYSSFGGQFLSIEATAGRSAPAEPELDIGAVRGHVASFSAHYERKMSMWEESLSSLLRAEKRIAIWGAGSKGATFLNTIPRAGEVHTVVDINPRKQGNYVPGTAHVVRGPDSLESGEVDVVLVMNPLYEYEIRTELADRELELEILVV